jgi:hypothetical protein
MPWLAGLENRNLWLLTGCRASPFPDAQRRPSFTSKRSLVTPPPPAARFAAQLIHDVHRGAVYRSFRRRRPDGFGAVECLFSPYGAADIAARARGKNYSTINRLGDDMLISQHRIMVVRWSLLAGTNNQLSERMN